MIRFRSRVLASLALAGAMAVSIVPVTGSAQRPADGPYTAYAQPLTIHVGWFDADAGNPLPGGQTQQNNMATRFVQKTLNVNFKWDFIAPQANNVYDQKVSLVLASGQMPDVMYCNLQEFHRLADAGQLADLSSIVKQYASPYMKSIFAAAPRALAAATIKGQVLAIPDTPVDYQYDLLWLRQDWLDKVHMAPPKTVDDLAAVAKAFIKAKLGGPNTIGLVGPSGGTTLAAYNGASGFDTLLEDYGAFEGSYLRKGGQIVYGSVQPEMKTALSKLHDLYQQGVIDPQFASRSNTDMIAQITGGKAGMFLGPWWAPFYPLNNAVVNNPKADWRPYVAPLGSSGKMEAAGATSADAFVVVRKGFAHPEAVMKVLNLDQDVLRGRNKTPAAQQIYKAWGQNAFWTNIPLLVQFDYVDNVYRTYKDVILPVQKRDKAAVGSFDKTYDRYISTYNQIVAYLQHPDPVKNNAGYALTASYMQGIGVESANVSKIHVTYPLDYYPTPTMLKRQATLQSLEQRTFFGIVTGQLPLSQFDSFVTEWKALGGTTILRELKQQLG